MPRSEFSRKVRARVFARAAGRCEGCGAKLKVREGEYDHVLPCALGGEAIEENCELLCRVCHSKKTATDVGQIRKADRQGDKHTGVKRGRGFRKPTRINDDGTPEEWTGFRWRPV